MPTYVGIGLSCCHRSRILLHHWKLAPRKLFSGQIAHLRPCGPPSSSSCAVGRQGHTPHLVSDTPHLRDEQVYVLPSWCGAKIGPILWPGSVPLPHWTKMGNLEAMELREAVWSPIS